MSETELNKTHEHNIMFICMKNMFFKEKNVVYNVEKDNQLWCDKENKTKIKKIKLSILLL